METLILEPQNKRDFEAIKALADALKIPISKSSEMPYNAEFMKELEESERQIKQGKFHKIAIKDLWK